MTEANNLDELRGRLADAGVEYLFGAYDRNPQVRCATSSPISRAGPPVPNGTVGALEGMGTSVPTRTSASASPIWPA